MSRKGHWMSINFDASYSVCPLCGFVRRNWWAKPLLHNGGKP